MAAYESSLEQFESNLKLLYKYGDSTFLKDDDEPFYFHCMCYYLPKIARETFDKHKLGLGIFTMQGFERRNKESKTLMRNFCMNNKTHPKMMVNNLKRLQQNFWHINMMNDE